MSFSLLDCRFPTSQDSVTTNTPKAVTTANIIKTGI
jgi:hypothetical protein